MKRLGSGDHHVVCLHGWFGSADGWGYWPEVADTTTYTWHFPNIRGYGDRMGESGNYRMAGYAADALAALDAAGIGRFSIVGHSMGGKAAASLLAQAGDRVRALIGISAVPPAPVPLDAEGTALFFGAPHSDENRRAIIDFTTGNRNSSHWLDGMVAFSRANSTLAAFAGALDSWVHDDYLGEIGQPPTPILCLAGATDPALSAAVMRQSWAQLYPNVEVAELASAGHYSMFESPVYLATRIEAFLAGH